jgi:hypothetical protein
MLQKNGRKHQRINLFRVAGITFHGRNHRHLYPIQDISLAGMFITGRLESSQGTSCSISLAERWSGEVFVMNFTGKVARHNQKGIGIQFTEMALKSYELLQTLLLYGSSDPLALCQEFAKGYPFEISEHQHKTACNF